MKIMLKDLSDLSKQGVYCIKNLINDKVYIGSTLISFKERIKSHNKGLKKEKHHNKYLQRSYLKYGKDNFEFSIIEIIKDLETIRNKESYYINFYNSFSKENGYNFSDQTNGPPTNDENRLLASIKSKELFKNPEFRKKYDAGVELRKGKPSWNKGLKCDNISNARKKMFDDIEVYDLEMNFFRKFSNPIEIEKFSKSKQNDLPIPDKIPYYPSNHTGQKFKLSYQNISNKIITSSNIHRAIRNNKPYKGLFFKKVPNDSNIIEQTG